MYMCLDLAGCVFVYVHMYVCGCVGVSVGG